MTPSVWLNKADEDTLRENDYEIPGYPEQGEVRKDGNVVGQIDNFSGLVITDTNYIAELKALLPNAGFWNC